MLCSTYTSGADPYPPHKFPSLHSRSSFFKQMFTMHFTFIYCSTYFQYFINSVRYTSVLYALLSCSVRLCFQTLFDMHYSFHTVSPHTLSRFKQGSTLLYFQTHMVPKCLGTPFETGFDFIFKYFSYSVQIQNLLIFLVRQHYRWFSLT